MNEQEWNDVDRWFEEALGLSDPALQSAVESGRAAGMPEIHVAPNQGRLLHLMVRACGAKRVLEIGTLAGYSAIEIARALPHDGRLLTLEADPKHAAVARENLARAGVADRVEIRMGPALETLPRLVAEGAGPFDFVFVDADKPPLTDYFEWSLKLSRPGTMMLFDNVVREGAVLDASSSDPSVQGVRRLLARLGAEPRVSATALQTVGVKKWDGFALAVVTA